MLNINRHHIRLLVTKFGECFRFYSVMLELPVRYGSEDADYAEFKTDSVHIALYREDMMRQAMNGIEPFEKMNSESRTVVVLRVDDIDLTYDYLKSKGIVFDAAPVDRVDWGCRTAHFRDPDGNLLELNSDLAELSP